MSERFKQLAARHEQLRSQSAVQRQQLAAHSEEIRQRLVKVDRGVNVVRKLARNPLVIVGGVVILTLVGPARLVQLATRGAVFLSTARSVLRLTSKR